MMTFMRVIVIVVIFLVRTLWGRDVRWPCGSREDRREESEAPLEIAKRRYARGEITKEEFEEIRKSIG
jgi:putative membrane protein